MPGLFARSKHFQTFFRQEFKESLRTEFPNLTALRYIILHEFLKTGTMWYIPQLAFICSISSMEILEQCVKSFRK